eukprot:15477912-Alexandrium_andersonii.AAC.1
MEFHGASVGVAVPEKNIHEVLRDIAGSVRSGRVQRRRCRSLLGKLRFMAGVAPTLKRQLRCL